MVFWVVSVLVVCVSVVFSGFVHSFIYFYYSSIVIVPQNKLSVVSSIFLSSQSSLTSID